VRGQEHRGPLADRLPYELVKRMLKEGIET
jgi:hypothetical protein